jgi:hypothetical protein
VGGRRAHRGGRARGRRGGRAAALPAQRARLPAALPAARRVAADARALGLRARHARDAVPVAPRARAHHHERLVHGPRAGLRAQPALLRAGLLPHRLPAHSAQPRPGLRGPHVARRRPGLAAGTARARPAPARRPLLGEGGH